MQPLQIVPTLRRLRIERFKTTAALSAKAGVHHNTLSELEAGRNGTTLATLERLAAAFEMPVSKLIALAESEREAV